MRLFVIHTFIPMENVTLFEREERVGVHIRGVTTASRCLLGTESPLSAKLLHFPSDINYVRYESTPMHPLDPGISFLGIPF